MADYLPNVNYTDIYFSISAVNFTEILPETNNIYHIRYDTRFTPEGKKVFMINEIQSDVNQKVAKSLSKMQQLSGENRINPFKQILKLIY